MAVEYYIPVKLNRRGAVEGQVQLKRSDIF